MNNNKIHRNIYYERLFSKLAAKWRSETGGYSTSHQITKNKNYIEIINLKEKVLPFIFKEMEKEPEYWFEALKQITKTDPVPNSHYGNIIKMTNDWLSWAKEHNYVK